MQSILIHTCKRIIILMGMLLLHLGGYAISPTNSYVDFPQISTLPVRPGDTNMDGKIDLRDLELIAAGFQQTGPARQAVLTDPMTSGYYPALDWTQPVNLPAYFPNLKHADCNGDGVINELDLAFVEAQADPLALPLPGISPVLCEQGTSRGETIGLGFRPLLPQISRVGPTGIQLPVEVFIKELPNNAPLRKVIGLTFSSLVAQDATYRIEGMDMDYSTSDFVSSPADGISLDLLHRASPVETGNTCLGSTTYLSETAIFNLQGPQSLKCGDRVGVCIVLLEDVLSCEEDTVSTQLLPFLMPRVQALTYTSELNGRVRIEGGNCRMDTMWIDLSQLPAVEDTTPKIGGHILEDNVDGRQLVIYPNPVPPQQPITIQVSLDQPLAPGEQLPTQVYLRTLHGNIVYHSTILLDSSTQEFEVPSLGLPAGEYLLSVEAVGFSAHSRVLLTE